MLPFVVAAKHKVYGMFAFVSRGDEGPASDTFINGNFTIRLKQGKADGV